MKMNIKKLLYGAAPLAMAVPLVFAAGVLVSPGSATAADGYVGSAVCGTCHASNYADFKKSGHPYKYRTTSGADCANGDCDALSNLLPTPAVGVINTSSNNAIIVNDGSDNLDWSVINYVIGGYGWKARFGMLDASDADGDSVDDTGYVWSGSAVQRNILAADTSLDPNGWRADWSDYNDGNDKKYECSTCHSTNGRILTDGYDCEQTSTYVAGVNVPEPWASNPALGAPGAEGAGGYYSEWSLDGVQCEACHGAGETHANSMDAADIDNGSTMAAKDCGVCHMRATNTAKTGAVSNGECGGPNAGDHVADYLANGAQIGGDFIKHHEQYNEMVGLDDGAHKTLTCVACHDPHKRTHTVTSAVAGALGITDNAQSAEERGAVVSCGSCHPGHETSYDTAMTTGHENVTCVDCHMAEATKSATTVDGMSWGKMGDVKSHIVKINTTATSMTRKNSGLVDVAQNYITLAYACGKCHDADRNTTTTTFLDQNAALAELDTNNKYHLTYATAPTSVDSGYVGSAVCGTCHVSNYDDFKKSGHPYKYRTTGGADCADGACDALSNLLPTPDITKISTASHDGIIADNGSGDLDWSVINYVIGGFGWKARFGMLDSADTATGYVWSGSAVQRNILAADTSLDPTNVREDWSAYNGGNDKKYECSTCHSTNGRILTNSYDCEQTSTYVAGTNVPEPWASNPDLVTALGVGDEGAGGYYSEWSLDGVQCEACHGAGATHVVSRSTTDIDNGETMAATDCGVCHMRATNTTTSGKNDECGGPNAGSHVADYLANGAQIGGDFIKHHEQYNEMVGLNDGVHKSLNCVACHDPHKRSHTVTSAVATALGITDNDKSAEERGAVVSCESCHSDGSSTTQVGPNDSVLAGLHKMKGVTCVDCHMGEATKSATTAPTTGWGRMGDVKSHIVKISTTATSMTRKNTDDVSVATNYLTIDYVCGKCHDLGDAVKMDRDEAAAFATGFHSGGGVTVNGTLPATWDSATMNATGARFNWYKGAGCNTISVDACMNNAATYSWASDGTADDASACATTITFTSSGSWNVTLTTNLGERSMWVNASGNSLVPDASMDVDTSSAVDVTGMSAKVTDTSSSNACGGYTGVGTIVWGDGSVTTGLVKGGSDTHTYSVAGTYMVRYSFRDSTNNKKAMADAVRITVPDTDSAVFDVTGIILRDVPRDANNDGDTTDPNETGVRGVNVYLKSGSTVVKYTGTDGSGNYTFYNVAPQADDAAYTIEAKKNDYIFVPVATDNDKATNSSVAPGVGHEDKDFTATEGY